MEGLGLGLGLSLNTKAVPVRVIRLSRSELKELKSHIDDGQNMNAAALKNELLRVIDTLLSNRLPGTDSKRAIVNLAGYKYALENNKDKIESIRSALLGEFVGLEDAAQAGGSRRKMSHARSRTKRRKARRTNKK